MNGQPLGSPQTKAATPLIVSAVTGCHSCEKGLFLVVSTVAEMLADHRTLLMT
jgi:hypothetical protein